MQNQNPLDSVAQIDAMRLGTNYRTMLKVRGFEIFVRPLSISETVEVAGAVQNYLASLPLSSRNQLTEHTAVAKETLKKASTSDVGVFDPKVTDYILDRMTNDEVAYLFDQYVAACDKVNPALEMMKPEQLTAIIEELKKNKDLELDLALTELSFLQLISLVRYFLTKGE